MKVAFVGGGKMAEAMVAAFIRSGVARPHEIFVGDVSEERRAALKSTHGINTYKENQRLPDLAGTVIMAVKPQDLGAALDEFAGAMGAKHLVISIAAGVRVAALEARLKGARVVRVMPNLACQVGDSMSAFTCGARATAEDRRTTQTLLESFGRAEELPEELFDVVTALGGSGPAFFAYVLQCLADAAVRHGMDRDTALTFATQTMLGTARVLQERELAPEDLIASVSSRKGTTAEGMDVLRDSDLADVLGATIDAAARRSRELSESA